MGIADECADTAPRADTLKKSPETEPVFTESARLTAQAMAVFWGGIAESVAQAFRAFSNELKPENAAGVGFATGFVDGVLAGNASFFQEMAKTSRSILEDSRASRTEAARGAEIDYDRLARLVAAELRRKQVPDDSQV
jgi:hypothetical protein